MGGKGTGITNQQERLFRMQVLYDLIKEHGLEVGMAKFQFQHGTSRRTTLDYIKVLKLNGKI